MIRAAVFASGNGSNFQALAEAGKKGALGPVEIALMVTDQEKAPVRDRARRAGIKELFIDPVSCASPRAYEQALTAVLERERIELILLAGYMRILGEQFVARYRHKIINIHPSLLPLYKGVHSIERAFNAREKETGVTVHFVDEKIDHGPVVLQEKIAILPEDTVVSLEEKVHQLEHRLYPQAVRFYAEGKVQVEKDGSVKIL